jgi:MFS family permease
LVLPSDARLVILARGARAFAYGLLGVLLAIALSREGISPPGIGVLIAASLIGDFCDTYVIGLFADQWGRRRTLLILALLMAATGAIFSLISVYPVLLVAAFFGTLGTSASETAPFLPIEQAILPQVSDPEQRTALFARYNLVASFAGAGGALTAGLPDLLSHTGLPLGTGIRLTFGLYSALALVVAFLTLQLSPRVEARRSPSVPLGRTASVLRRLAPNLGRSRGMVLRLSALGAL